MGTSQSAAYRNDGIYCTSWASCAGGSCALDDPYNDPTHVGGGYAGYVVGGLNDEDEESTPKTPRTTSFVIGDQDERRILRTPSSLHKRKKATQEGLKELQVSATLPTTEGDTARAAARMKIARKQRQEALRASEDTFLKEFSAMMRSGVPVENKGKHVKLAVKQFHLVMPQTKGIIEQKTTLALEWINTNQQRIPPRRILFDDISAVSSAENCTFRILTQSQTQVAFTTENQDLALLLVDGLVMLCKKHNAIQQQQHHVITRLNSSSSTKQQLLVHPAAPASPPLQSKYQLRHTASSPLMESNRLHLSN